MNFTFIAKRCVSARLEVVKALVMKFYVAWYVTLCRLVISYGRFGGTTLLRHVLNYFPVDTTSRSHKPESYLKVHEKRLRRKFVRQRKRQELQTFV
jgi:hypothetical protein